MIRVIGFDQGRKSNRIYDKGKIIAYSDTKNILSLEYILMQKVFLVIVVEL